MSRLGHAAACALVLAAGAAVAAPRIELRVGLCTLETPPEGARALEALSQRVPFVLGRLESDLGVSPSRHFRVLLIPPGAVRDSELVRLDAGAPRWAAAYAIPAERLVAIRLAETRRYPYGTPEAALAHELAHLALHDDVGDRLPLWFEEGVCTWAARSWRLEDMMIVSARFLTEDLPRLAELDPEFRSTAAEAEQAYAASFAFVSWSARRYGPDFLRETLQRARTRPFALAWEAASGEALERSERAWRRDGLIRFRWVPILTASGGLWLLILFIAVLAWWRKRSKIARIKEAWDREETEPWYEQALNPEAAPVEEVEPPQPGGTASAGPESVGEGR